MGRALAVPGSKPLKDPQHELFCRHYANCLKVRKAYELANYEPDPKGGNAYRLFRRKPIQERIAFYVSKQLAKLDITVEKTLKHLAAIGYNNPLDMLHVDEEWIDENTFLIRQVRLKSPTQLSPHQGATLTKVKENVSPDGGVTMEYGFESKTPALRTLLEYLQKTKMTKQTTTVVVKHKGRDGESKAKIKVKKHAIEQ
ncbi:MAG: terminase small subunit [Pseudohongiellaceae bacterium]